MYPSDLVTWRLLVTEARAVWSSGWKRSPVSVSWGVRGGESVKGGELWGDSKGRVK